MGRSRSRSAAVPPPGGPRSRGLRQRKRERTRERLAETAWQLAALRGFEGVTADEIAAAAGVSRSTFFRYFGSKEAVLFVWREPVLAAFDDQLRRRRPGERGFDVVRRALLQVAGLYQRDREAVVARQRIINATPALVGHEYEIDRAWEDAIARTLLVGEGRSAAARRRAQLRAGAVLGVLRVTLRHWIAGGGRSDLVGLGQEVLDWLEDEPLVEPAGAASTARRERTSR